MRGVGMRERKIQGTSDYKHGKELEEWADRQALLTQCLLIICHAPSHTCLCRKPRQRINGGPKPRLLKRRNKK